MFGRLGWLSCVPRLCLAQQSVSHSCRASALAPSGEVCLGISIHVPPLPFLEALGVGVQAKADSPNLSLIGHGTPRRLVSPPSWQSFPGETGLWFSRMIRHCDVSVGLSRISLQNNLIVGKTFYIRIIQRQGVFLITGHLRKITEFHSLCCMQLSNFCG